MNKFLLTFLFLFTISVVNSEFQAYTQFDFESTTLETDYHFMSFGEKRSDPEQSPAGQYCLAEDDIIVIENDLVVEAQTYSINLKMAKENKLPNFALQQLMHGDDEDEDNQQQEGEGEGDGEGEKDDEDDGIPKSGEMRHDTKFVWVHKTSYEVLGADNSQETDPENYVLIPWFHWWFVAVDSTGKPKWTKNTFDESQPWDVEMPPLNESDQPLFDLNSGDKVKFIGEAEFKYFANTMCKEENLNMKPYRFVAFDLLTTQFTMKANLEDMQRFRVVPFSSLNIVKADGTAVSDAEVQGNWPQDIDATNGLANYCLNTQFDRKMYQLFKINYDWLKAHHPMGWVYIHLQAGSTTDYQVYTDFQQNLTADQLIAVPWVQWFFKPQSSTDNGVIFNDYPNFFAILTAHGMQFWNPSKPPMTMDTSGSIVPLWSDTDTVRFVIDATKLGLLNAMSQDYEAIANCPITNPTDLCLTRLCVPVNVFTKKYDRTAVVAKADMWQYTLVPWSSADFTAASINLDTYFNPTTGTLTETELTFNPQVYVMGQVKPMIAYFDEATKELLVSAKGKALNTIIVKLFNPMEIEVRVGTEVKNPLPKDVDFKKWPLNANYKYYLKASVTVSAQFEVLPVNKETKKIDFVSEVYDPKVLAYPYDANLFAVALPSMIDTTVADQVDVALVTNGSVPEYPQMDGDQEGNMDDKDDDNDLVLIINRDTNIVDWKATFGQVQWDFTTHYYFPPVFFMLEIKTDLELTPQSKMQWNLENPPYSADGTKAWDPTTFGFNKEDMSDFSNVKWDLLPELTLTQGNLLYGEILFQPWMIFAKVSNDNYKTTWTLDTIYDDAQRYAWPCNIDFIINYRVKKLFDDQVITKPDFGLRCEKVREMVKKLKDQGKEPYVKTNETELRTQLENVEMNNNALECRPPMEEGDGPASTGDGSRLLQEATCGQPKEALAAQLFVFKKLSQGEQKKSLPKGLQGCETKLGEVLQDQELSGLLQHVFEGENINEWYKKEQMMSQPIKDQAKLDALKADLEKLKAIPLSDPSKKFEFLKLANKIVSQSPRLQQHLCNAINLLRDIDMKDSKNQEIFQKSAKEFLNYFNNEADETKTIEQTQQFSVKQDNFKDILAYHGYGSGDAPTSAQSTTLLGKASVEVAAGGQLTIPVANYQNFKGKLLVLKGVSELLNKEGAGTGVQWETYYPFSVAETPLPYEIVDDLSSILYVTSVADTNTKLNKIEPDTKYTLHYQYDTLLSGATPVKVELWEGDHNEYPEGEVVTASGTKTIEYNGELIVGVQVKLYGIRIEYADKVQLGIIAVPIEGKPCTKLQDAPKIALTGNFDDNKELIQQVLNVASDKPKFCTSDEQCQNSGTCDLNANDENLNKCQCATGYQGPFCGFSTADFDTKKAELKTLLDSAGSNPDNAVTALKYTATVGAVDKEVMQKARAAVKATLSLMTKDNAADLLKAVVDIKKLGKGSVTDKTEMKDEQKANKAFYKEFGQALMKQMKTGGSVQTGSVDLTISAGVQVTATARRILVDTELSFTAESSIITPSQLIVPSTYPSITQYNGYFSITAMSEYSESEGYDYLVSPVTYVSFIKQSDGTEVEFDDSANPVKLVLYIKTYDASKTYKPMKYDTDTDTLAIDDTLTILNQDESQVTIQITSYGSYAVGYEVVQNEEEEQEEDKDQEEDGDDDDSSMMIGTIGFLVMMTLMI